MRRLTLALATIVSALPLPARQQSSPLDSAAWLAGCWELRAPDRIVTEMWMPPFGGSMIGGSRTVTAGVTREFEHLRLTIDGSVLVYTALPSGQRETPFRSTQLSDTMLVFENLQHDFPQRIIYRRRGADSIIARIEGPGPNNTTRGINFAMRRASCTTHGGMGDGGVARGPWPVARGPWPVARGPVLTAPASSPHRTKAPRAT